MKAPIISTFGCRLNSYESAAIEALCKAEKFERAVIINTCAVTAQAVRKARQDIRRLARENPKARVIVTGCAAQIAPQQFAEMPEVDAVLGNQEKLNAQSWRALAQTPKSPSPSPLKSKEAKIHVSDIMRTNKAPSPLIERMGARARAYVQVQNGCNHRCTFCIIPYGRGNSRSVPIETVIAQISRFIDNGYKEVVLTGVDIVSWGEDLGANLRLGDLVHAIITRLPALARLRISSLDTINIDPLLEKLICTDSKIMPHLHLSLQSGDDMILKRMKRRHLRAHAIAFCQRLRKARPEIAFGADIIAGFPTESAAMFENSLKIITECDLTWLHIFPFSARLGTPAARMPQLGGEIINGRAKKLRELANQQVQKHLKRVQGARCLVLMESPLRGRCPDFSEILFETPQPIGELVQTLICGLSGDGLRLKGRPI